MNFRQVAKNRVSNYLNEDSFDPGETAGAGMSMDASNYIADTKYGAAENYSNVTSEATMDGIDSLGSASSSAQSKSMIGGIGSTIGSLALKGATMGLFG